MDAVRTDVEQLIRKEYLASNLQFPLFHSQHEGYAVMLEEIDELEDEMKMVRFHSRILWDEIKRSVEDIDLSAVRNHALNAAIEAIQVAAMCDKFVASGEKE